MTQEQRTLKEAREQAIRNVFDIGSIVLTVGISVAISVSVGVLLVNLILRVVW